MDGLAHALWANLAAELVGRKQQKPLTVRARVSAMVGAVMPDLIPFIPYIVLSALGFGNLFTYAYIRFSEEWGLGLVPPGTLAELPNYLGVVYSYTHSGLLWLIVFIGAVLLLRRLPLFLLGWGTHIALDVFTHDGDHFPTKLLYPFSEFHIDATAWSNPIVLGGTYIALLVCYLAVYSRRR